MSFRVIHGAVDQRWYPVDGTDTLYVGQLVMGIEDGVKALGSASGAANITNTAADKTPLGIVSGTNRATDLFDTTYRANSVIGVASVAGQAAVEKNLVEGPYGSVGDTQSKVQVDVIDSGTVIRGKMYDNTYGTALTESVVSVASADGGISGITCGAPGTSAFTTLQSTIYYRTGLLAGIYRVGTNTTNTAPTHTHAGPVAVGPAVDDVMIQVPIRMCGLARIDFDSASTFVDINATYGSNYYQVNVLQVDLRIADAETVDFQFTPQNWATTST